MFCHKAGRQWEPMRFGHLNWASGPSLLSFCHPPGPSCLVFAGLTVQDAVGFCACPCAHVHARLCTYTHARTHARSLQSTDPLSAFPTIRVAIHGSAEGQAGWEAPAMGHLCQPCPMGGQIPALLLCHSKQCCCDHPNRGSRTTKPNTTNG